MCYLAHHIIEAMSFSQCSAQKNKQKVYNSKSNEEIRLKNKPLGVAEFPISGNLFLQ